MLPPNEHHKKTCPTCGRLLRRGFFGWLRELLFGSPPLSEPMPVLRAATEAPTTPTTPTTGPVSGKSAMCGDSACLGRSDPQCKAGNCARHCLYFCQERCR